MRNFSLIIRLSLFLSAPLSFSMEEADKTTKPQNNLSLILMSQKLCQKIIQETSQIREKPSILEAQERLEEISQYNKTAISFLNFLTELNLSPPKSQPPLSPHPKTDLEEIDWDALEIGEFERTEKVRVIQKSPDDDKAPISQEKFFPHSPTSQAYASSPKPSDLFQGELYPSEGAGNKRKQPKAEQDFAKNWRTLLSVKLQNLACENRENFSLKDYPGIPENLYDFEHPSLKSIKEIFLKKLGKEGTEIRQYKIKNNKDFVNFIKSTKTQYSDFDQFIHSLISVYDSYSLLFQDHHSKNEEMNTYVVSKKCQGWLKDRIEIIFRKNDFAYLKTTEEQKRILNKYLMKDFL